MEEENKSVLQLLASSNFITVNKTVARKLGLNSATLLGALCSYQVSFNNQEFFKEQDKISEDTCLSIYEIRQATEKLKNAGILTTTRKGIPAKNYYLINENKMFNFLTSSDIKNDTSRSENFKHLYINNTTTNNSNNNTIKKESKQATYEDIINQHIESEEIKSTLYEFIKMRKLIKKPMTNRALELLILKLRKMANEPETAIAILNQSITNSWQDIYELKENKPQQKQNRYSERTAEETEELLDAFGWNNRKE